MNRISIKNLQTKIHVPQARIKKVARLTLRHFRISDAELSVVFVTEAHIKRLNAGHLNHPYSTDILTFDYRSNSNETPLYAEIVVCPTVAARNAAIYQTSIPKELDRYLIHGILHLCGFDDRSSAAKNRMTSEENRIIELLQGA